MPDHKLLEHLKKDHEEQKRIAKQLIGTTDPKKRESLRQEFHEALYPHIMGEEASIFKALRKEDEEEAKDVALEALQEHHVAKIVLKELMDLDLESEVFKAKITVLDELNRHHIEEEEDDVFEQLRTLYGTDELDALFEQYEKGEEQTKSK